MSEACSASQGPVAAPARRSARLAKPGAVDPRTVPCSLLGEKTVRARRIMGPGSGEELVSTSCWLRAHEKEPQLPPPHKLAPKERRKAALPARDEVPPHGLSSGRDFVQGNMQEAAAAEPRYHEQHEVRYVFKPHFGELPPYLRQRKREAEERRAAEERALSQPQEEAGVTVISGEQLAELVLHLKLKWQAVNEAYVRLPCVLDTPSKRRRKQEMEAQLVEIERDVAMLSKATSVQVSCA